MKKTAIICLACFCLLSGLSPLNTRADQSTGFNDIGKHWAKDYITQLHDQGYITGYADGSYKPDYPMTRAEFTTLLINSMKLLPSDNASKMFSDTGGHWAAGYINAAVQKGILIPSEYPNGLKPDASIKRSEVCAMLVRALSQSPSSGATSFKDQETINQSMYKGYIKAAVDLGLISGYTDGTFNPFGNMKRGEICRVISVFIAKQPGSSSTITPAGNTAITTQNKKISTFSYNDYRYNAYYIPLFLNSADTGLYLSDMTISDENTVIINSQSCQLDESKVSIQLGDDFYDITKINLSENEISPVLKKTVRLIASQLTKDSFSDIYINDRRLDLDDISTITFIIDGSRKKLKEIRLNGAGEVFVGSTSYPASKITVIIDDDYYQLKKIVMDDNGDFQMYCKNSSIDDWVMVNNKYYDMDDIQIVYDGETYSMDEVYVAEHNKIRVSGKQRSLDSSFKLKMGGLLYTIEEADEGGDFYIAEFQTDTDSFSGGEPDSFVFYNQETVCYSDDPDAVSILVDDAWISFDRISITNPAYYSYSSKTYEIIDSKIKINSVEFKITDTAWHGKSRQLDIIMKPL